MKNALAHSMTSFYLLEYLHLQLEGLPRKKLGKETDVKWESTWAPWNYMKHFIILKHSKTIK